ncbi:MAG: polyprenyl synthetase family protein [Clostridia bacterium]|nr:polyprenyl synthetase family protein [Clostridia bacterium]
MNFNNRYKEKIKNIDTYISEYLSDYKKASPNLIDAMKYSVLNGGKRLRSVLCTEVCSMLGGDAKKAMPFACGIELIHAYSLVHDDLPAMDNADTRRGQPSCHKKYGEAMGILCGDALLNSAYELMLSNCDDESCVKAAKILAETAGSEGMITGQVKDLYVGSSGNVTKDVLIDIIEQKTMAIIRGSVLAGSIIAGANDKTLFKMEKFAYSLGLAFQIRDDFEDIAEDVAGQNDCPNFINAMGESNAKELLDYHSNICKQIISEFDNKGFLTEFLNYLF